MLSMIVFGLSVVAITTLGSFACAFLVDISDGRYKE